MYRRSVTFSVLQAIAVTVSFAIILWSLGVPSLRFAEAANVTSFSNTLSDSAPSVAANHTISFVTPSGLAAGDIITLNFPAGFTGISALNEGDLDLAVNGTDEDLGATASGATWGVSATANAIDIQSGTDTIGANATVTIEIGTNATFGATGDTQITNPATSTSYEIGLVFGTNNDTGSTIVVIVDTVTVTAAVDAVFTFTVDGVADGVLVNTADSTGGATTATEIPFGTLQDGNASTAAQELTVATNAASGFVVTVEADQQLTSANGADIDSFLNGNFTSTPTAWAGPSSLVADENTWGHWGVSSNDTTLTAGLSDLYSGGDNFVAISGTPVEVFRNDGPTDGNDPGVGIAQVIYKVEISALQEAADDYTATLTYVATPIF